MKKIIFLYLFIICLGTGNVSAYIAESDMSKKENILIYLNIINESGLLNADEVSRGECIISIMRAVGVCDEEINTLNGADFYAFADTTPYSYFGCAYAAKIAYGEECMVDYPTYRTRHTQKNTDFFFFPERAVTVKEALAFMVRCLEADKPDFEDTLEKAKGYGLTEAKDEFVNEPDSAINRNDFCILLKRFLNQKRCKYYQRESFNMRGSIDKDKSITYLEFLAQSRVE